MESSRLKITLGRKHPILTHGCRVIRVESELEFRKFRFKAHILITKLYVINFITKKL